MNKSLVVALLISAECVLFFAFVMPQYRTLRGTQLSLESRKTLLADTQSAQRNIVELNNQYISNEATIASVLLALPAQRQYDYITESFQAAASSHGVRLISLVMSDIEKSKGEYQIIPFKAEISSGYVQLLGFLDTLEHSLRLYDITRIDISESDISGGFGNSLHIILQGNAYSLK